MAADMDTLVWDTQELLDRSVYDPTGIPINEYATYHRRMADQERRILQMRQDLLDYVLPFDTAPEIVRKWIIICEKFGLLIHHEIDIIKVMLIEIRERIGIGQLGYHDETSEDMRVIGGSWVIDGPPTPGVADPPDPEDHLVITEFAVTPTELEFIEIANPTEVDIELGEVYLSDHFDDVSGYYDVVTPGYTVPSNFDFNVKFPDGYMIEPCGVRVVANTATGYFGQTGLLPDFEITDTDPTVPDMVNVGGNIPGPAVLTNSNEIVMMYEWDGASDLVCDLDYISWGTPGNPKVDKTGRCADGPDGDLIASCYRPDTNPLFQYLIDPDGGGGQPHSFGNSAQRNGRTEASEVEESGNGCDVGPGTGIGEQPGDSPLPSRLQLAVYPNPFNPVTEVKYVVPQAGRVKLQVFDVSGRVVATLVDAVLPPGEHRTTWNGKDSGGATVSAGIYFMRAVSGGSSVTTKAVLLK
jgi:hypothetical protein